MASLAIKRTEPAGSQKVPEGDRFTLEAQCEGDCAGYIWHKDQERLAETSNTYSAKAANGGKYRVQATIDGEKVFSDPYTLEVKAKRSISNPLGTGGPVSQIVKQLAWPVAFGVVLVVGYGIAADWSVLIVAAAVGAAAFGIGALLGFVFGIPRSLTSETAPIGAPKGGEVDPTAPQYQPNTNLEQVSDWLTKILIGIGLAQAGDIVKGFADLVDGLKPALGDTAAAHAFAGAEIIYFLIAGFLCSYLLARLRLQSELEDAQTRLRAAH